MTRYDNLFFIDCESTGPFPGKDELAAERAAIAKISEEVLAANNYSEHYEVIIRSHVEKVLSLLDAPVVAS